MSNPHYFSSRKEARDFLKTSGTKVAAEIGFDGPWVFMEKMDFIKSVINRQGGGDNFMDYDGETREVFVQNGVLHIPIGVN